MRIRAYEVEVWYAHLVSRLRYFCNKLQKEGVSKHTDDNILLF